MPALVSQSTGWGRPPPSSQPVSGRMAARGTEVDSDSPLMGEQARLRDYKVIQYLFIYSPWVCLKVRQSYLSALSPECSGDPSSAPTSLVPPGGEPHPETCCWIQGSSGYPDTDPSTCECVHPLLPPALFWEGGKVDKKMKPKCQCPAEPATHPSQDRALSAQSWSRWGTSLRERVCGVRKQHVGSTAAAPALLGRLPAQEGACTREGKKYLSDKTL